MGVICPLTSYSNRFMWSTVSIAIAFVGGVPAKVLLYHYDEEAIELLLKVK